MKKNLQQVPGKSNSHIPGYRRKGFDVGVKSYGGIVDVYMEVDEKCQIYIDLNHCMDGSAEKWGEFLAALARTIARERVLAASNPSDSVLVGICKGFDRAINGVEIEIDGE